MEPDSARELAAGGVKRSLREVLGVADGNVDKSEGNVVQSGKDSCVAVVCFW
jgi:hypothetical protein